jgi:hypothetical protein
MPPFQPFADHGIPEFSVPTSAFGFKRVQAKSRAAL